MVRGVILETEMEDIPRQAEAAVVVDRLDHRKAEEDRGRSRRHPRYEKRDGPPKGVQQKALQGVVVESSDGVGDDQPVMLGVHVAVEELVLVHVAVHEVLPRVHHQHGHQYLHQLDWDGRLFRGRS